MARSVRKADLCCIAAKVALLFFVAAIAARADAQSYLYNRADYPTGKTPYAVIAADFNGDGKLDLAVANRDDNTVSILLGKPDGTFAPQVTFATGTAPVALVAADFNVDGKLDLAVANNNPNGPGSVSLLIGNGDGTFQDHADYQVGTNPVGIVAADFNGDSKPDLAVPNNADSTVSILLGNGDGTLQAQATVAVGTTPVSLSSGDFNGDGNLDLITSNSGSTIVTVLLSSGDGTFTRIDSPAGGTPAGIAVGDFNGDGMLDVVIALPSSNPSILLGNGDGSFQNYQYIGPGPIASLVVAGDFGHDGKLDLAFAQVSFPQQEFAQILRGNGDGTFQEISTSTEAASASSLFVADFNGDGQADLAATAMFNNVVSILLGSGDCTFDSSVDFTLSQHQFVGPLLVTDFDGDGKPDVAWALAYGQTATINVLLGEGNGGLSAPIVTSATAFAPAMAAGDFNGDGKTDLALGYSYNNAITLLSGNGDGTFAAPINTSLPSSVTANQMAAGDLNGDGRTDLVVYTSNSSNNQITLTVYFGTNAGTFAPGPVIATSSGYPLYVAVDDFNRDGKLDLAYAVEQTSTSGAVFVLLGNGNGTFQSATSYAIPVPAGPPVVSDVNGDGKSDLVVPVIVGFSVLLGNGDGTFQSQIYTQVSQGDVPGHVVIADFDGDGKPDVAVDFPFSILLGNGDGTFQPPRAYAAGAGAIGLGSADFNSDGVADLVLGNPVFFSAATVDLFLSAPAVALAPTALAFGNFQVRVPSTPQNVALTNIGNAPLSVFAIAASGDFSQTNECGATLAVRTTCVVSVTFTPTVAGIRTGVLTFTDNTIAGTQSVALMGTGLAPEASTSPSALTFSAQPVGSSSAAQTVTLSNSGTAILTISSIEVTGDFGQTNTCGSSVAVGGNCTIDVTFAPTAGGTRTGTLTITDNSNGVAGSTQAVTLTGTGTGPVASLSTSNLTFGSQLSGTTSGPQTVTLSSTGTTLLTLHSIAVTGANATDFAQTNNCGTSVAVNGTCIISVTFTPSAGGMRTAAISITDNAADSPQTVSLSGTGDDFTAGAASGSSTAQSVTAGGTATYNLAFTPNGASGTLALSCAGAPAGATCTIDPAALALSGTSAANATVTVTTTAKTATLVGGPQQIPPAVGTLPLSAMRTSPLQDAGRHMNLLVGLLALLAVAAGFSPALRSAGLKAGATILASVAAVSHRRRRPRPLLSQRAGSSEDPWIPAFAGMTSQRRAAMLASATGLFVIALWAACGGGATPPRPAAVVKLSASSLTFNSQNMASTSASQSVTLTNSGNAWLAITSLALGGSNSGDFILNSNCTGAVSPGANCQISVKFSPKDTGARSASVTITDDAEGSPRSISLSGTGVPPATPLGTHTLMVTATLTTSAGTLTHTIPLTLTVN